MYLLENVFTSEHGEAITVLQLITKIKTSISQIDEVLNTYLIRLDAIDNINNTQNTDILILKGNVDLLKSQVANIFTTLGDYLLQLHQLDILTQTHSSQITDIQNVNQSQGIQLINLNSKSLEHDLKITGLETNVTNINISLNNINNSIGDYLLQLQQLDILTQTHSTQITDIQNVNQSQGLQLINLNSKSLEQALKITGLETLSDTQSSEIVTIKEKNINQDNSISAINTAVGILDDRLDVLENSSIADIAYTHNLSYSLIYNTPNTKCKLGVTPVNNHNEFIETYDFTIYGELSSETIITIYEVFGNAISVTIPPLTDNFLNLKLTVISKKSGPYLSACQFLTISGGYNKVIMIRPSELTFISSQSFVNYLEFSVNKNFSITPIKYLKNIVGILV